jgi:hypothetical protein
LGPDIGRTGQQQIRRVLEVVRREKQHHRPNLGAAGIATQRWKQACVQQQQKLKRLQELGFAPSLQKQGGPPHDLKTGGLENG